MYIQKRTTMAELMNAGLKLPPGAGSLLADARTCTQCILSVLTRELNQHTALAPIVGKVVSDLWLKDARFVQALKQPERPIEAFFKAEAAGVADYQGVLTEILGAVLKHAPGTQGAGTLSMSVPLIATLPSAPVLVENIVDTFMGRHLENGSVQLGAGTADTILKRLARASNLDVESALKKLHRLKGPKASGLIGEELVTTFLAGTPFAELLLTPVPIVIPEEARFSHMACISGPGGGKSQLIGHILSKELTKPKREHAGLVVLDSTGDLFRKVTRSKVLAQDNRLLIVDVEDAEHLPALNLFGLHTGRNFRSEAEQEAAIETTIDLTEYVVAGMMDADFTSRQAGAWRYLIRLMLSMPGATLLTLQDVLDNPLKYLSAMERQQGVTRAFFEKQFIAKSYNPVRTQISGRVSRLLSNRIFEKMFSSTENRLNIGRALDDGRLIAVNTSRATLKDGCGVFGRFILANVLQAGFARSAIPPEQRRPAHVLVDEAAEYLDQTLPTLMEQTRKYRIGICVLMQATDQMDVNVRSRVMASTAIKLAGGGSAKDARSMADDLQCSPEFILAQQKDRDGTRWATYVRGLTPTAVSWPVKFGALEDLGTMSEGEFAQLQAKSRAEISVVKLPAPVVVEAPPKPIRKFSVVRGR